MVPSAGSLAPVGWNATADHAVIFFWSVQLSICGWYQIAVPLFRAMVRGHPVSALVPGGGVAVAAGVVVGGTVAAGVLGGTVVAGGVLGGTVAGGLACEGAPAAGVACARSRPPGVAIVAASNTAHQRDRGKTHGKPPRPSLSDAGGHLDCKRPLSIVPLVADPGTLDVPGVPALRRRVGQARLFVGAGHSDRGAGRTRADHRLCGSTARTRAGPGNERPDRACPTRHRGRRGGCWSRERPGLAAPSPRRGHGAPRAIRSRPRRSASMR